MRRFSVSPIVVINWLMRVNLRGSMMCFNDTLVIVVNNGLGMVKNWLFVVISHFFVLIDDHGVSLMVIDHFV